MCNTEIGYFCSTREDWLETLSAPPFNLKIKRDGNYVMFSYDQISSDFNLKIVQEARGIIFRNGEWEHPVCWAFNKFGNYGESYVPDIDWTTSFVTEKVDGSLIKMWYDGTWKVSTNGTINAFKAEMSDMMYPSFGDYFDDTLRKYYLNTEDFLAGLKKDLTYMFELVGPYNRVVVPYEEPAIYFLGVRDTYTGEEYICNPVNAELCGVSKLNRPKTYQLLTLDECIKATEELGWDEEGFVVCDANFNRVKVKSPAYVMAHYARNNNVINRKHLIKVVLTNEVDEFLCYAADYKEELLKTQKLMTAYLRIGNQLAEACRSIANNISRADYARLVKALPKIFQGLLFCNYDRVTTTEEYTSNWSELKWEEYLEAVEKLNKEILEV
jgi:T4 RnlA family RNA ligase